MTACSPSCLGRLAYVARIPLAQHEEPSCCRRGTRPSPCPWRRPPCDDPPSSSRPLPTHRASSCAGSSRSASSPARAAPDQQPSGAACIGERLHDSLRGCKVCGKPIRVYENALVRARPWEHWRRLHGTWQARPAEQDLTEGLHGVKAIGLMVCNDHRAAHRLRAGDAGASSLSGTEPALFSLSSSLFPLL